MPKPPVTSDIGKPLDAHRDLTPQVSLNPVILVDQCPDLYEVSILQILHPDIGIHPGLLQYLLGQRPSDTEYSRQPYLDALVFRQVNTCDPRHLIPPSPVQDLFLTRLRDYFLSLPLSLFVPRIF